MIHYPPVSLRYAGGYKQEASTEAEMQNSHHEVRRAITAIAGLNHASVSWLAGLKSRPASMSNGIFLSKQKMIDILNDVVLI